MLETFLFALGIITGFTVNALTNAGRFRKVEKTEESLKIERLIEENRYLSEQVIGCKNRLENIENKSDIEHKKIRDTLNEIQLNNAVDSNILYKSRKEVKELKETTCRQANNLKNCIKGKNKRRRR